MTDRVEEIEAIAIALWDHHTNRYPNDPLIRGAFGANEDELGFLYVRWSAYAEAAYEAMQPTIRALQAEVGELREAAKGFLDAWDWWRVDEYDRDAGVPDGAAEELRAILKPTPGGTDS